MKKEETAKFARVYWREGEENPSRSWFYICIVTGSVLALGTGSDFALIGGDNRTAILIARGVMVTYFLVTGLWARLWPQVATQFILHFRTMGYLAVGGGITFLAVLSQTHIDNYMVGIIEAQFVLATFAPLPTRRLIPLLIIVNGGYILATFGVSSDPATNENILVTLTIVGILTGFVGHILTQARVREFIEKTMTKNANKKLEDILASITDAFLVVDRNWQMAFANEAALKLLRYAGYEIGNSKDTGIWTMFPNLVDNSVLYEQLTLAMEKRQVVHFEEYYPLFRAHMAVSAYPTDEGISVYGHDVTAIKLAEEAARLRETAARVNAVREEEKLRLARDLHDDLGQVLSILKMDMAWLQKTGAIGDVESRERVNTMTSLVQESIETVKRITRDLHPAVLESHGLIGAINWLGSQIPNRTGLQCRLDLPEDLPMNLEPAGMLFRIIQEATTNVIRHAEAHTIWITLLVGVDTLDLLVEDDGQGVDSQDIEGKGLGLGIRSMRERAAALDGKLEIMCSAIGTTVQVSFPFPLPENQTDTLAVGGTGINN